LKVLSAIDRGIPRKEIADLFVTRPPESDPVTMRVQRSPL
jgi:hypothetical protein